MKILILILFIFFWIFFFLNKTIENFSIQLYQCPKKLIRIGPKLFAYFISDKKKSVYKHMIGINPIVFNSLNEYKNYLNYQYKKGVNCPILKNNDNMFNSLDSIVKENHKYTDHQNFKNIIKSFYLSK